MNSEFFSPVMHWFHRVRKNWTDQKTAQLYFATVAFVFLFLAGSGVGNPVLVYGDAYSDANTLVGGENLHKYGFAPSYGIPYFGTREPYENCVAKGVVCADTHYPGIPYWVNAAWRYLGIDSLRFFRIFSLSLSLIFILLLPAFFHSFKLTTRQSYLASGAILLHPFFISYADSIHQFPYNFLFLSLFVLFWQRFLRSKEMKWAFATAGVFFLSTFTTFEYFLFLPVLAGMTWLEKSHRKPWQFLGLFIVGIIPVITLALRLYHHSFLWGSWSGSFNDLFHAASYRSGVTWAELFYHFQKRFLDFHLPLIPLALFYFIARRKSGHALPLKQSQALGYFFLAAASWWLSMKQHAMVHSHVSLLWLSFYGAGMALLLEAVSELQGKTKLLNNLAKICVGFALLISLLRIGSTPQLNLLFPLWPKEHKILTRAKADIQAVNSWVDDFKPEKIYVDSETRGIAYHSMTNYEYAQPGDMCKDASIPYVVPDASLPMEQIQKCIDTYGQMLRTPSMLIFFKPK